MALTLCSNYLRLLVVEVTPIFHSRAQSRSHGREASRHSSRQSQLQALSDETSPARKYLITCGESGKARGPIIIQATRESEADDSAEAGLGLG